MRPRHIKAGFVFLERGETMRMNGSGEMVNGIDVTGVIASVERYDGGSALVVLSSGVCVVVAATHEPVPGDTIVEGELSL
ncbi:hypothetical protein [Aeromonas sp. MdU4]|uniref:hypothetical protein n=1 Tax=Aeromonas sp. MdU4 TaxID=3342819 RepID=UPI0035BBDB40